METNKKSPTQPWKPASFLKVERKYLKSGFRQRWLRKDNLEKGMAEGWMPVQEQKGKSDVVAPEKTMIDGTQVDTTVQRRTLILCEIPEEIALSRERFFSKLTDTGIDEMKYRLQDETCAYGTIKIKEGDKEG